MRLNWRRTWNDRPNDGIGEHPDFPDLRARVYEEPGGGRWFWVVNETYLINRGLEATKDDAKLAATEAAERWVGKRSRDVKPNNDVML